MTVSQYKNIIQWTLYESKSPEYSDSLKIARKLFKNLGISFPQGNCEHTLRILSGNTFLGWRSCNCEQAQKYANLGIVTIGIDKCRVVVILPDREVPILTGIRSIVTAENPNVKHTSQLSDKEQKELRFFSYRYGFEIEE